MKLTIDRTKWLRGEMNSAMLRTSDSKMCCLGFLAVQCGYTDDDIRGQGTPYGTARKWTKAGGEGELVLDNKFPDTILSHDQNVPPTLLSDQLITTNDNLELSERKREERLTRLFKEAGIEVEFIN